MFFKNIKNQKGITGADIVISATMIVLTVAVVSMIYVNTTLESRNVTRTAGATRIATNILENIEKLSYEDFIEIFNNEISEAEKQVSDYYLSDGGTDKVLFSTKIPAGYSVYIKAEPNYGSHSGDDKKSEQFDLVRDIGIIVKFDVGDRTEEFKFETVKSREIIDEVNKPATEYLTSNGILKDEMNYYPVKHLDSAKAYIKVNEKDDSWYNYTSKKWATVIVSKKSESDIFDINGKFIGKIDTNTESLDYTERFVWIPRFFKKVSEDSFYAFAYLGIGNNKIVSAKLNSNSGESNSILTVNTFTEIINDEANIDTTNFNSQTGKWVSAEGTSITTDVDSKLLNTSKYGPYISY